MKLQIALIAAVALAGSAEAGSKLSKDCTQVAQLTMAPAGLRAAREIDQLSMCHRERARIEASLQSLRNQIADAKAQLSKMTGLTFMCVDQSTSRSSKGDAEDCSPNACDVGTGRCLVDPNSTTDCSPGYVWDVSTDTCVRP